MKQRNWTCETEPLHTDLGFKAQYNLNQGLAESIRWSVMLPEHFNVDSMVIRPIAQAANHKVHRK